ncbi:ficolin-1-A-like [Argopecten irradians]|uniref:ficolin-1-A-like n=1 Tax=Argopecten irradians TaxID=31199 RepID=UPI003717AFE6
MTSRVVLGDLLPFAALQDVKKGLVTCARKFFWSLCYRTGTDEQTAQSQLSPYPVIQNRLDGEVGFHRNWTEYQDGFGDLQGSFWAGLDIIRALTQTGSILRIEMVTVTGAATYAQYSYFSVGDESSQYRLSIWGYSGNARRWAGTMTGIPNYNCAERFHGGWWYNSCYQCHLNGPYVPLPNNRDGYMTWGRGRARIMKTRMLVK